MTKGRNFLVFVFLVLATLGCSRSSSERTVTTSEGGVTRTETRETVTESDDGCGGVLSCTVDVVGEIIALPFRAVGALFDAIF
jgi:hypothetical protein